MDCWHRIVRTGLLAGHAGNLLAEVGHMSLFDAVDRSLEVLRHTEVLVADSPADRILEEGLAVGTLERNLVDIGCMGPT